MDSRTRRMSPETLGICPQTPEASKKWKNSLTYTDGDADQGKTASYQDQQEPEYIYVGSSLTSRSRTESELRRFS